MRLGTRIMLVAAAPLLGLAALASSLLYEDMKSVARAERAAIAIRDAPFYSNLAHQLQKERGMSAGFVSSKGDATFNAALTNQRTVADDARKQLEPVVKRELELAKPDSPFAEHNLKLLELLETLPEVREQVTALNTPVATVVADYTEIVSMLLVIASDAAIEADDHATQRAAGVYAAILQAKETAGLERAVGSVGFAQHSFPQPLYKRFAELGASQALLVALARKSATDDLRVTIDETLTGPAFDRVQEMREEVHAWVEGNDIAPIAAPVWFDAATERISAFKTLDNIIADRTLELAEIHFDDARGKAVIQGSFALVVIIVCIVVTFLTVRSTQRPINAVLPKLRRIGEGDTSVVVTEVNRRDEIGDIGRALEAMRLALVERDAMVEADAAQQERERKRAARIEASIAAFQEQVEDSLSDVARMTEALGEVSCDLMENADMTSRESVAARSSSTEASEAVQSIAAAIEEMTASIGEISGQLDASHQATDAAASAADQASKRVASLSEAAHSIGNISTVIAKIAKQTNLLALNATIEAQRAGPAGISFSVVAHEVKALADETATATEQIDGQIEQMRSGTEAAVSGIGDILSRFEGLRSAAAGLASAMSQQSAATQEIGSGVEVASRGAQDATSRAAHVVTSVDQTTDNAKEVQGAAQRIENAATALRNLISSFLADVRTT
ncbi:methyl-accepting chemotaxis protein [Acuticoccus sp. MNP-M23]|uniref:methyl-accepting chemotaxis protein n=1 Tax=Acuticoccus sp. MNP-M23 TaxID=3072793 RepID=UPI0028164689|nr:methyl-accepting chemotaxis protein [Acuticoccus sp. MNP-M23]WMS41576.1 methyl-accepting chemotaxis protein [Acuticoccus sp. MNP-M23]